MKKFSHPFFQLLVLAMLSLALMVVSVVIGVTVGVTDGNTPGSRSMFIVWNSVSQILMFGLPTVLIALLYYRDEVRGYLRLDFSSRR